MSRQHSPLWSPELYALGVPPIWVVWVLLYDSLTTVGSLVGVAGPPVWLAARHCLVQRLPACPTLVDRVGSRGYLLWDPACPEAGVSLLVSAARSQRDWLRGRVVL